MTKDAFSALLQDKPCLLDGATGSNLMARGMPRGVCTELWVLEHPEVLQTLQKEYLQAGSQVLYAPTFNANPIAMASQGLEKEEVRKLNRQLLELTRRTAGDQALVAGDMTTVAAPLEPLGKLSFTQAYDAYCLQAEALYQAGADLLVAETMMGVEETVAAAEAVRSACDLPLLCSFSTEGDGKCYFDGSLQEAAPILEHLGICALGLNCSAGPAQLESLLRQLKELSSLPLLAKPNAGLPSITPEGEAVYSLSPEDFAQQMAPLVSLGVKLVGGCCGTPPAHIRALKEVLPGGQGSGEKGFPQNAPFRLPLIQGKGKKKTEEKAAGKSRRPFLLGETLPLLPQEVERTGIKWKRPTAGVKGGRGREGPPLSPGANPVASLSGEGAGAAAGAPHCTRAMEAARNVSNFSYSSGMEHAISTSW